MSKNCFQKQACIFQSSQQDYIPFPTGKLEKSHRILIKTTMYTFPMYLFTVWVPKI